MQESEMIIDNPVSPIQTLDELGHQESGMMMDLATDSTSPGVMDVAADLSGRLTQTDVGMCMNEVHDLVAIQDMEVATSAVEPDGRELPILESDRNCTEAVCVNAPTAGMSTLQGDAGAGSGSLKKPLQRNNVGVSKAWTKPQPIRIW